MPISVFCPFCFKFTNLNIVKTEREGIKDGIVVDYNWFKCEHCNREWMERDEYPEEDA